MNAYQWRSWNKENRGKEGRETVHLFESTSSFSIFLFIFFFFLFQLYRYSRMNEFFGRPVLDPFFVESQFLIISMERRRGRNAENVEEWK